MVSRQPELRSASVWPKGIDALLAGGVFLGGAFVRRLHDDLTAGLRDRQALWGVEHVGDHGVAAGFRGRRGRAAVARAARQRRVLRVEDGHEAAGAAGPAFCVRFSPGVAGAVGPGSMPPGPVGHAGHGRAGLAEATGAAARGRGFRAAAPSARRSAAGRRSGSRSGAIRRSGPRPGAGRRPASRRRSSSASRLRRRVAAVTRNRRALRERQRAVDGIYSLPVAGGPNWACRRFSTGRAQASSPYVASAKEENLRRRGAHPNTSPPRAATNCRTAGQRLPARRCRRNAGRHNLTTVNTRTVFFGGHCAGVMKDGHRRSES